MYRLVIKKTTKIFLALVFLALPKILYAADSAASLWADKGRSSYFSFPVRVENLPNLGMALIYLIVFVAIISSLMTIMIAMTLQQKTSGNDDKMAVAEQKLTTGLVSLFVSITVYFSLDYIFILVRLLSDNFA